MCQPLALFLLTFAGEVRPSNVLPQESSTQLKETFGVVYSENSVNSTECTCNTRLLTEGELGQLNQLRGRLDIKNLENVLDIREAQKAKLYKKEKLHHLGLCWSKDVSNSFKVLELLKPNQQLKVIDITGYMGSKFPPWISSTTSVTNISIIDCGCKELPSLGQLLYLIELHLKGMASIQYIGAEFYEDGYTDAFSSLEQLGLYDMPTLLEWSDAGNNFVSPMFRRLKTPTVEGCPQLQNIPTFGNLPELIVCNSNDAILSSLDQTRFGSLSSLLIKNMGFFKNSSRWPSLKKLIIFNITDHSNVLYLEMNRFTGLEYFCIAHCPKVREITLSDTISIPRLHVVDCPNLERIYFSRGAANLTELLIDACPELYYLNIIFSLSSRTKLIIRGMSGGDQFGWDGDFKELEKLQYLSISESPQLERKLEMEPSLISHIPCVLLGNRKRSSGT